MFFIVNKTKKTIVIGELKVSLGPHQALDLDKIVDRSHSDGSKELRAAISQGKIDVRVKDGIEKMSKLSSIPNQNNSLEKIKEDIIDELKKSFKELSEKGNQNSYNNAETATKQDLKDIVETIKNIAGGNRDSIIKSNSLTMEDNSEISEELLIEMNARTIDKIARGAKVQSLQYEEKEDDSTILNNIDELENLL